MLFYVVSVTYLRHVNHLERRLAQSEGLINIVVVVFMSSSHLHLSDWQMIY